MKKFTDKELATFMLETRQRGPRYLRRYFKLNGWRWPLLILVLIIFMCFAIFAQSWGFCGYLIGLACGMFARDMAYMRYQRDTWPFYAKTSNWELIEKIAKAEQSVS
ncbi:MAG TPA: hypothetical protein VN836_10240 [Verrucomicrobiae bacterium]|nr:hypothetical protein [Verrucomicrobiae bacterium]